MGFAFPAAWKGWAWWAQLGLPFLEETSHMDTRWAGQPYGWGGAQANLHFMALEWKVGQGALWTARTKSKRRQERGSLVCQQRKRVAACQTSLHSQGNGKDQPFIALSLSLGIYRPLVKPAFYSVKLGFLGHMAPGERFFTAYTMKLVPDSHSTSGSVY